MSLLYKVWFAEVRGYPIFGWLFMVLLFSTIAYFVIGTLFFGMESAPRCDEYICYREY